MSQFFKEHLFGALVIGSAFGAAIGFSIFAPQHGPTHASRYFLAVMAVILVKLLFDAGRPRMRVVTLRRIHPEGRLALMRFHYRMV